MLPFFIFSCNNKIHEEIVESFIDGKEKKIIKYRLLNNNNKLILENIFLNNDGDTIKYENLMKKTGFIKKYDKNKILTYMEEKYDNDIIRLIYFDEVGHKNIELKVSDLSKMEYLKIKFHKNGLVASKGYVKLNENYIEKNKFGLWTYHNTDGSIKYQKNYSTKN